MESAPSKSAIRQQMEALRQKVLPELSIQAGNEIARILASLPEFHSSRRVALFASLPGEPDTRALFDLVLESGREALFPRCNREGGLDFVSIGAWSELERGRFGVLEPEPKATPRPAAEIDLFLVPGVAFDRTGGRLGRGRGFYDRSLPEGAFILGLALDMQWVDHVPQDALDRSVHGVLTEAGLVRTDQPL